MKYPFDISYVKDGDNNYWVVKSKVLNTVIAQGDTADEALTLFNELEEDWLQAANKYEFDIPILEPESEQQFSGKFIVRVSKLTHEKAAKSAKVLGVSLNQYINDIIVDSNAVINTLKDMLTKGTIQNAKSQPKNTSKGSEGTEDKPSSQRTTNKSARIFL